MLNNQMLLKELIILQLVHGAKELFIRNNIDLEEAVHIGKKFAEYCKNGFQHIATKMVEFILSHQNKW